MSEYKSTFMDRMGPDGGAIMRAVVYAIPAAIPACAGYAALGPGKGMVRLAIAMLLGVAAWALAAVATYYIGHGAGQGFLRFIQPSGETTPYVETFSQQEALAMKGQLAEALASYEELIAAAPADPEVRIAAAEMYARTKADAKRAEALYREARRLPALAPVRDLWITNRLIDLYRGQLDDEGRALVELRRIVERFPSSREAAHARDAIARIKREAGEGG